MQANPQKLDLLIYFRYLQFISYLHQHSLGGEDFILKTIKWELFAYNLGFILDSPLIPEILLKFWIHRYPPPSIHTHSNCKYIWYLMYIKYTIVIILQITVDLAFTCILKLWVILKLMTRHLSQSGITALSDHAWHLEAVLLLLFYGVTENELAGWQIMNVATLNFARTTA